MSFESSPYLPVRVWDRKKPPTMASGSILRRGNDGGDTLPPFYLKENRTMSVTSGKPCNLSTLNRINFQHILAQKWKMRPSETIICNILNNQHYIHTTGNFYLLELKDRSVDLHCSVALEDLPNRREGLLSNTHLTTNADRRKQSKAMRTPKTMHRPSTENPLYKVKPTKSRQTVRLKGWYFMPRNGAILLSHASLLF